MSKRANGIAGTLAGIIIAIVVIVAVALVVYHYMGDLEELVNPNFGVIYNDTTYRGTQNGVELPETGQAVFTFKNASACTFKVVPNFDFTYTVDGVEHHFEEHDDLTGVFIERGNVYADYFVINCKKADSFSVENVIRSFYEDDAEIVLPTLAKVYPFRLVLTSNTGDEVWLQFGQGEGWASSGIDPDHVTF